MAQAALIFDGRPIYGTSDIIVATAPKLEVKRTFFWGIKGMAEVIGNTSGRELTCHIWLHNRYGSRTAIETGIKEINSWVGDHGSLRENDYSSNTWLQYDAVTFHGFERASLGGRGTVAPVFDYAGTVDGGWIQAGMLTFFQLKPE